MIGVFFAKPFISGYAEEGTFIFESACQYLQIVCIGSLFLNIQVVLEKVLQSTGNMVAPMKCSLTGAIVNVILDPILIFGLFGMPQMGVAGAALATIIGQMCGMIMGVSIVLRGEHLVNIKIRGFKMDWKIVADIYKVGLPSIVMQSIASVMIIFYNMILVAYSTTAVAVLGVYFRIQSFVFMPVFGLNQGAMPILGYNYGAKNKDRLMKTYKEAFKVALIVMAAGTLLFRLYRLSFFFDIRRFGRNAQDRSSGSQADKPVLHTCRLRHNNGNAIPGNGSRSLKPVCFGDKTTCRNSAAGIFTDKDRRSDAFLAGVSSGRNIGTHIQRYHAQVAI